MPPEHLLPVCCKVPTGSELPVPSMETWWLPPCLGVLPSCSLMLFSGRKWSPWLRMGQLSAGPPHLDAGALLTPTRSEVLLPVCWYCRLFC